MKVISKLTFSYLLLGTQTLASSAQLVTCTKSKNDGGILLYGNSDWDGGWTEVYADSGSGASFDLMFEMDCDAGACDIGDCRTFDFDLFDDAGLLVAEHSFDDREIPYQHYLSSVIDHSIFDMSPFSPVAAGDYTYCITSHFGGTQEAMQCGTLTSLMDSAPPVFTSPTVVSPDTTTVPPGTTVQFDLVVADDTVLNFLNVNVNGEYYQRIGLKTVGNKVSPSGGNPRSVLVTYAIPSKGKVQPYEFNFRLCDLTNKCVEQNMTINVVKEGGGGGGGKPPKV